MKCQQCGCQLPQDGNVVISHWMPIDCRFALAAAQGAVSEVIDNVARKLGEKHVKEYARKNGLTHLL